MKYKSLLISDLDETLQHAHKPLSKKQVRVIEGILEKGALLSIISGASVKNIYARVISKINPIFFRSIVFYANNGGVCFQACEDLSFKYIYDHSIEFKKYKAGILEIVSDYFIKKGMGKIEFAEGRVALGGVVCVEDKESQITIILKGRESLRGGIVSDLSVVLKNKYKGKIVVFSAGTKSIDILLSNASKGNAVEHLLQTYAGSSFVPNKKVVIAGDSFHTEGPDLELLHVSLEGATVFCAGESTPKVSSFVIVQADKPSPSETYKFLKKEFEI